MAATLKTLKPGQFIFKEGEPSKSLFLIKKGTVAIRKMKGSNYVEIARIYTNEVVGEISFFDRRARSAAAVAYTDVEVLEIDFDSLDSIWNTVPDYMKTIMASVAERLRKADDTIRRLQHNTVPADEPMAVETKEVPELESLDEVTEESISEDSTKDPAES